ncbi:MAG: site-specific DNA-methyltransferase [Peptostreptococcaceae bacterium]|nr:site-specific DNA-methyltransferase [Peptostreptococcaceae bacterium]
MDKMKMETDDIAARNVERIGELFPNCITEMLDEEKSTPENKVYKKAINFELLKQMLSGDVIDGDEAYEFTWVGKKAAIVEANKPIRKTLRPCKEESVNWDTTENLYIEGDNLEVLKLLQESYLGKVKMIYIDPPYNTGNDFIYRDDFKMSSEEYADELGVLDEEGNRLFKNTDSNGRFHSDWCSMIYSRLMLARNLLSDDGVIFISIDDNEQENLKKICDEVFGASNFIANIIWKRKRGRDNSARWFSRAHEYCVVYSKTKDLVNIGVLELDEQTKRAYKNPDNDPRGDYRMLGCWARGTQGGVKYDFETKDGKYFKERLWLFSKDNLKKLDEDDKLIIRGDNIYRKMFISENKGKIPETLWDDVSNAANASDEIKGMFDNIVFDTPKPIPYIKRMLDIAMCCDGIILDFFSGSATSAHAVMQLNAEDGGNRKFIMVQLPEQTDEKSEAYKVGYKNICKIGKERIRRAGKKILEENKDKEGIEKLDIGFRVLKLDDSNMKDVFYSPNEYSQDLLTALESNVKSDRGDLDLLFGCLLEWGLPLSLPYHSEPIGGCTIHNYNDGDLMACFDEKISEEVIQAMAKRQPLRAVFRDGSFADSPSKINVKEIFKFLSPDTRVKVL